MSAIGPGWYKDPAEPTTQRYWDGEGWIGDPLPSDATPPPGPPAPAGTAPDLSATADATPVVPGWPAPFPPVPPPPAPAPHPAPQPRGGPLAERAVPQYGYPAAVEAPRPHGLTLATPGARLLARLIDIGVLFALNAVVNGWFAWQYVRSVSPLVAEMWRRALAGDRSTDGLPQPDPRYESLLWVITLLTAALWFAYEVPALASTGQTLGKRLLGIKVVRLESAEQLGFGRSFRRWNTLGLPTLLWTCCGVGFLLQLIDCLALTIDRPLHQALHDKSANTVVVHVERPGQPATTDEKTPGGSS